MNKFLKIWAVAKLAKEIFYEGEDTKMSYTMEIVFLDNGEYKHQLIVSKGNRIPSLEFNEDGTKVRIKYGFTGKYKHNCGKWLKVKGLNENNLKGLRVIDDTNGSVMYSFAHH